MKKCVLLLLSLSFLFISCGKNDDDLVIEEPQPVTLDNEINDFVWRAMNSWYLWQEEVLELGDDRFTSQDDYYSFLNQFNTPRGLFQTLESPRDRFSAIVDDYDILFNSFAGVFKTNGLEYTITRPPSGENAVIAVVRYVIPGSSAAATDIKRGDIIYAVNGTELFAVTDGENRITASNLDLLNPDEVTLNLADIIEGELRPNDKNIALTKTQIIENPVLLSKVVEGTTIGYIMYTSFTGNFDSALNEAVGELKAQGIENLVLDLRYNTGGSVLSAVRLCSMITGQFNGDLLSTEKWNTNWQPIFGTTNSFVNTLEGTPINSLNLNKVYVITTTDSASASEFVINSLEPYIDVIQIGEVTRGKNEFSVTLVDSPDQVFEANGQPDLPLPYIVLSEERGFTTVADANPNHKYALQPLVGTNENADGFSEFTQGLTPDFAQRELLSDLGELGDAEEPLLALTIQLITGVSAKSLQHDSPEYLQIKTISSSARLKPFSGTMVKDNF